MGVVGKRHANGERRWDIPMTISAFREARGKFRHLLLRNECFDRIGADRSVLDSAADIPRRAALLAARSCLCLGERENLRRSARVWLCGNGVFGSVEDEASGLWKWASELEDFVPGPDFPTLEAVRTWAFPCNLIMQDIEQIICGEVDATSKFSTFWKGALELNDWLASFSDGHPGFWRMLRRPPAVKHTP